MGSGVFFLGLTFLMVLIALFFFIRFLVTGHILVAQKQANVIFEKGEKDTIDDPAVFAKSGIDQAVRMRELSEANAKERRRLDASSRRASLLFLVSSVFWLILASIFGLLVSLKFHMPDFLGDNEFLTFGILRPLHLNQVAYGWLSMAGMGCCIWLIPRLTKRELIGEKYCIVGSVLWNIGVLLGSLGLLFGITEGVEWLEFHWAADLIIAVAGGITAVPIILTVAKRREPHIYVSLWYIMGGFLWFPLLFVVANIPNVHFGVEHAIANWWFAHNVLGLWLTPLGLALAYYLIPKIIGRPIYSYQLSIFGFWALALFYAQVGVHHLVAGPVPTWLVNLSIVMSAGMIIPVVTVAINHHITMIGHFHKLWYSPTLRFVVFGAMMYTVSSAQGSLHAFRTYNYVSHFTHWTVSHAHLGAYGFTTMILFAAIYFIIPRLLDRDWPAPELISLHFWGSFLGIIIYVFSTGIGGWLQGLILTNASATFQQSVEVTLPYLITRTIGGSLIVMGHLALLLHLAIILLQKKPNRKGPAYLNISVDEGAD